MHRKFVMIRYSLDKTNVSTKFRFNSLALSPISATFVPHAKNLSMITLFVPPLDRVSQMT